MVVSAGERMELYVSRVCSASGSFLSVELKATLLVFGSWKMFGF